MYFESGTFASGDIALSAVPQDYAKSPNFLHIKLYRAYEAIGISNAFGIHCSTVKQWLLLLAGGSLQGRYCSRYAASCKTVKG